MATEAASPHAREARAEQRWAARGQRPYSRSLMWLARVWPWAWRVRLDLIVLFNLALGLLCAALAHILAPAIIVRTDNFAPQFASNVLFTIEALAALSFAVWWGYSVSRSTRLRQAARHAAQPGLVLTIFVFLSFVFWIIPASASPHIDMLRDPTTGHSIETVIRQRLGDKEPIPGLFDEYGQFTGFDAQTRPSIAVCTTTALSERASDRNTFLCALARQARAARISAYDRNVSFFDWRADGVRSEELSPEDPELRRHLALAPPSLGAEVMRFARDREPWRSRIAAMNPWERPWDVLDDPALADVFARSAEFERFVATDLLFGESARTLPERLFQRRPIDPRVHAQWQFWQLSAEGELMASATFAQALKAAEQSRLGLAEPPVSEDRWAAIVAIESHLDWKRPLLLALVREGKFDAQIRAMAPYRPASDFWRKVLVEPSTAPEAALERGFLSSILANLLPGICAALALALFLVVMNQAGLGATLAALAANAGFAFVLSMLASNFSPSSYGDEYTPYYLTWSVAAFAILAPLALVALALWRRVRTRTTALFGAASVWAATIWLPIAIASYWSYRLRIEAAPQALPYLVLALPLLIVALARLVQSMLTRASRLPLAQ